MDHGTWVARIGDTTYVWPRSDFVHVFGTVEYIRRLSGETRDASPARYVAVNRFIDYGSFRRWCRDEHRARGELLPPGRTPLPRGNSLSVDLRKQ